MEEPYSNRPKPSPRPPKGTTLSPTQAARRVREFYDELVVVGFCSMDAMALTLKYAQVQ